MRVVLALLLIVHGLIHLLGFLKAFDLAAVPLTGQTLVPLGTVGQRVAGIGWLVAAPLVVAAGALMLAQVPGWWQLGAPALLLSQGLVVLAWPDAKAGTIANAMLAVLVLLGWAADRFHHATAAERRLLLDAPMADVPPVTEAQVAALPPPIARWLSTAGVVGRPAPRVVWLRQRGHLRTSPDASFAEAEATQVFTTAPPAFVWEVKTSFARAVPVLGRDSFRSGRGRMRITAAGLASLVDASGPKIDEGTLLRYLGELVWFPAAALAPYVRWSAVDAHVAEATMELGGVRASARFTIDDAGRFTTLTAERYQGNEPDAKRLPWVVRATQWRRFAGVEVPSRGSVLWRLPEREFDYYRWEITNLDYDPPAAAAR